MRIKLPRHSQRVSCNKALLFFSVSMLFSIASLGQGIVRGTIKDETGAAVPSATIQVNGQFDASTDIGEYSIRVNAGPATIQATAIGFKSFKKKIEIKEGEELVVDITLAESTTEL